MASRWTLVREGDGPCRLHHYLQHLGLLRFLGLASSRLRPPNVACTIGDPAMMAARPSGVITILHVPPPLV